MIPCIPKYLSTGQFIIRNQFYSKDTQDSNQWRKENRRKAGKLGPGNRIRSKNRRYDNWPTEGEISESQVKRFSFPELI